MTKRQNNTTTKKITNHFFAPAEKSILRAFLVNVIFAIIEFIGGIITGSMAISSDAIHDFGDSITLGIAFLLERKSRKEIDKKHTYGFTRYSTLGALITTTILVAGSIFIISESLESIASAEEYEMKSGLMLIFAAIGMIANLLAVIFTRKKHNANEHAINLHMIEDVLGNLVILIGAIVINLTGWTIIDPILSIIVASFIIIMAIQNIKPISTVFLEKTPDNISIDKIKKELLVNTEIKDVHHLHFWSIDEEHTYVTLHAVSEKPVEAKKKIRQTFKKHNIDHVTIEIESPDEICEDYEHKAEHINH